MQPYSKTPLFNAQTLPKALRKDHNIKKDSWGVLNVSKGKLLFTISETGLEHQLVAPKKIIVEPLVKHYVTPMSDDMEMQISFYSAKPDIENIE